MHRRHLRTTRIAPQPVLWRGALREVLGRTLLEETRVLLALSLQLVLRHALADAVGELEHTGDARKVQPLIDVHTVSGKLPAAREAKPS